ncbi:hypothetical protein cypCar_00050047 [Cyprinus carpio]|nr:hypothetical protein cypCar_00050047 [Cyprinus carpio]
MSDFGKESNPSTETCKQGSAGERGFKKRLGIIACVIGGSLVSLYAVTAPFVAPALRKVCLPCTCNKDRTKTLLRSVFQSTPMWSSLGNLKW